MEKLVYAVKLIFDPLILSAFIAAFLASLFWIMALAKMELTKAYPFMSISPALVFLVSVYLLNETFTLGKVVGLLFIALGVIVTVKF